MSTHYTLHPLYTQYAIASHNTIYSYLRSITVNIYSKITLVTQYSLILVTFVIYVILTLITTLLITLKK